MNQPYEPTLSQRNTGIDYQKFAFQVKAAGNVTGARWKPDRTTYGMASIRVASIRQNALYLLRKWPCELVWTYSAIKGT